MRFAALTTLAVGLCFSSAVRAEPAANASLPYAKLIAGIDGASVVYGDRDGATIALRAADGAPLSELHLTTAWSVAPLPRVTTHSYYVTINARAQSPLALPAAIRLAQVIDSRDDGSTTPPRQAPIPEPFPKELAQAVLAAWIIALVVAIVRRGPITFDFRLPHAVPAAIQLLLLTYWSLYWPGVSARVPSILLQIALAYAVDAAVMFGVFRRWKISFGPLPIVLSANLFAWLSTIGAVVCVVVAVSSRAFFRRGERHIFNPSALGLAVAGLLSILTPYVALGGVFHAMRATPNMAELLLLLALLPQVRFRIVLATVGVVLGQMVFDPDVSHLATASFLVMFALFITDPATMPSTPLGRLCFGLFIGLTIPIARFLLHSQHAPDDLQKVLPVPFANLLVPWFDQLGARFGARFNRVLNPRWNLAHVALWLLLIVPSLIELKPRQFQGDLHWAYGTPFVVRDDDDVPRCEHNPVFCRPFSFWGEAELWAKKGK